MESQENALDNSYFRLYTKITRQNMHYRFYTKQQKYAKTHFTLRILHSILCTKDYGLGYIDEGFCTKIILIVDWKLH